MVSTVTMKKLYSYFLMACLSLAACGDNDKEAPIIPPDNCGDNDMETPVTPPDDGGVDEKPSSTLTGYAHPDGVLLLSGGNYLYENAFLTFISPDGEMENRIYAGANGAELGNDGVGLYLCDGKQYILCNDSRKAEGKDNNGLLTVADAETMVRERSFSRAEMRFLHPQNNGWEALDSNLGGIAVLDEHNIFIFAQGVLRFDSATGELKLVEGAYYIGNAGSANTVESIVSPRGATVANGRLYAVAGGFWSSTALLEFAKGKDEVNRRLELGKGSLVSGMCLADDGTLIVGTYTRGRNTAYLSFVDLDSWTVTDQRTIAANISPALNNNSGLAYLDGYIYFTGAEETEFTSVSHTTLSRYSVATGRVEKDIVDFKQDEPDANWLDCNIVADRNSGRLYVATSQDNQENVISETNLLVYDCQGDTPRLVRTISNVTHSVKGIYPLSMFSGQP